MNGSVGFTAGPWSVGWQNSRAKDFGGGIRHWSVPVHVGAESNFGNAICIVHMGGPGATASTQETVEANAALISAAPDMYEALVLAKQMIDVALDQFDWGKSALSGEAIRLRNEAPIAVNRALSKASPLVGASQ